MTTFDRKTEKKITNEELKNKQFRKGVYLSWFAMTILLMLLFSGRRIHFGNVVFKTIALDNEFIIQYTLFIGLGVWATISLTFISMVFALIIAFVGALGRLSSNPPIYAIVTFYITVIRGTPLLLQVFFFFLALPQLGLQLSGISAGVLALALNYGAYLTELVRSGIQAVDLGQTEAALALGMTKRQLMHKIILPQAIKIITPSLGNHFIAMLKDTSLIATTGFVWEILWRAQKVGQANFRNLEALLIASFYYLIITVSFSYIQSKIELQMKKSGK